MSNTTANPIENPIEVVVECHGALTQTFGNDAFRLQLAGDPPDVNTLMQALRERQPQAGALIQRSAVARGEQLLNATQALAPDDHLALIPPVSGG